jgi:Lrp/AsnC family leucine-responsive transcriptional regulator
MAGDHAAALDQTDWRVLSVLQRDARISFADLARQVAMSPSAVAERVRRLEESGVITGYRAAVSPERVGLGILAFVRLRYPTANYRPFHALLDATPEIVEAHHVTGEDCFMLKVVARSMRHLEEIAGRIGGLGSVTTSVVYSSPLARRDLAVESLGEPPPRRRQSGSASFGEAAHRPAPARRRGGPRQSMAN